VRDFSSSHRRIRSPRGISLGLALAALLACGGCWEEIHYVPKPGGVQPTGETAEQPAEETAPAAVAESVATEPISIQEPAVVAPVAVDPPVEEAETSPSPEADELFSSEGPAEIAAASAETPPVDGSILPTPDGLAADLEQAESGEGEDAGGETPRLAATEAERRLVWEAASKWSLAAAIAAKGLEVGRYQPILDEALTAAAKLEVELPPLPTTAQASELEAAVIEGLRGESGVALTNAVAHRFGPAEAAAADLAIRSHLLLLTYSPRSGDALLQAEALRRAAEASGLPAETWTPLVTLVDERAPFVEVRQAVFEQSKRVADHLGP
jgi:hypothetical protein